MAVIKRWLPYTVTTIHRFDCICMHIIIIIVQLKNCMWVVSIKVLSLLIINRSILCIVRVSMMGYATDETKELMPLTCVLAHELNKKMAECRRDGTLSWIRPDTKSMV